MLSVATVPFSWHHLNQWRFELFPIALLILAAIAYALATRRVDGWPAHRTAAFFGGLLVTFLAVVSVVGVYDDAYFSDHMIQHLALIMVAAPLLALGAPLDLAYRAGEALRPFLDSRFMRALTHPLVTFALYFVFIPITHLTGLYNLSLSNAATHNLEHLGFVVIGYLFFRGAFGIERGVTIHPGLRLVYVMAAVPVDTFVGLALAMESHNPFSRLATSAPSGATPGWILDNVHLGGDIMWIGGDALMLLACIPISVAWVRYETKRTFELDRLLDEQGL